MSATVKFTYMCPRCEAGITSDTLNTKCPSCNLILGAKEVEPYQPPLTLTEQHIKYKDSTRHLQTILELEREKVMSMFNDCLCIIEMVGAKKGSEEDIRSMLEIAIRIGQIAESYQKFLDAHGLHVPELALKFSGQGTTLKENQNDLPQSTRTGENSTEAQ